MTELCRCGFLRFTGSVPFVRFSTGDRSAREALADDAEVGVSAVVPVLRDGVFVDAVLG
jgi:hypothetical protein